MDFDTLYDEVFPSLFRYCQRLTGDPDVAEDVAQEAFVRRLESQVVGERAAVRVWLFKVATHLVRDRWKLSTNRKRLLATHPVTPGAGPDPERETERREEVASVRSALDTLNPRDRELLLHAGGGVQLPGNGGGCRGEWRVGGNAVGAGSETVRRGVDCSAESSRKGIDRSRRGMSHPDEGCLRSLLDDELPADEADRIRAHVASCSACDAALTRAEETQVLATALLGAIDVTAPMERRAGAPGGTAGRTA